MTTVTTPATGVTGTTTEPRRAPDIRGRAGVSVRVRLSTTMALLTSVALLTAGIVIHTVESARREAAAVAVVNQEIAEFRQLVESGKDPGTAEPFAGPEPLLRVFLQRNVPGDFEMLAGWLDGRVRFRSASPHPDLVSDPAFLSAVRPLVGTGGQDQVRTSRGVVLLAVQPVRGPAGSTAEDAALVVVVFLDDELASLEDLMRTYVVVALLAMVLITGLAAWQAGRLLSPLRRLSDTAREITVTDLSRRIPESGNDDISELTRTVNDMLSRLETAFAGQRQFLDDAGHELRTPLTILRGHLELVDPDDPAEVAETRHLLLDEVDRMGRLVDDLILLAKSRRPDFLTPSSIDLESLTTTLLAKARGMADRDWGLDGTAAVRVVADEQRLTQAVLQLVDNAVKHTDVGDLVAIGSAYEPGRIRLWVRDSGDGIPPADRERVFERFGRGDVRPEDEGFGLGLSIVRAIAQAHHGCVRIDDSAGGGATVTIELPVEEATWRTS